MSETSGTLDDEPVSDAVHHLDPCAIRHDLEKARVGMGGESVPENVFEVDQHLKDPILS